MGRGIDSRNRVSRNWVAKLHRLAGRYDNPMPTWFLAPIAGLKLPTPKNSSVVHWWRMMQYLENSDHGCWVGLCGAKLEISDFGKIRQNRNHRNMKTPKTLMRHYPSKTMIVVYDVTLNNSSETWIFLIFFVPEAYLMQLKKSLSISKCSVWMGGGGGGAGGRG